MNLGFLILNFSISLFRLLATPSPSFGNQGLKQPLAASCKKPAVSRSV
jgi:hypothetical protein